MHIAPAALLGLFLLNVASAAVPPAPRPPAPRPPSPQPPRKNSDIEPPDVDINSARGREIVTASVIGGFAGLGVINWIGDLVLLYP
ncbi:hypothetical protein FRC09_016388 [Ceratobasidium sp. 395]|nr:hypothetical protein FRC09_016388 [Ceratobasidium sp. 395]